MKEGRKKVLNIDASFVSYDMVLWYYLTPPSISGQRSFFLPYVLWMHIARAEGGGGEREDIEWEIIKHGAV